MTDVTGFGLLGHLIEMCEGSGLSARLENGKVPLIEGIETYTNQFVFPDNTYRNWNSYEKKVDGVKGPEFITLCEVSMKFFMPSKKFHLHHKLL